MQIPVRFIGILYGRRNSLRVQCQYIHFFGSNAFDPAPVSLAGRIGHGTDKESKSPPYGRASGTVRRSVDGGKHWEASTVLNGHDVRNRCPLSTQLPIDTLGS